MRWGQASYFLMNSSTICPNFDKFDEFINSWWLNQHFESSIELSNRNLHIKLRILTNFHKILWSPLKVPTFFKNPSSQSLFVEIVAKSCIVDRKAHLIDESPISPLNFSINIAFINDLSYDCSNQPHSLTSNLILTMNSYRFIKVVFKS